MSRAFELKRNLDHIRANQDFDVWHIFNDRKERFHKLFWRPIKIESLPPYRFEGKIEKRLSWLDYPRADPRYPIVSKNLANALNDVKAFHSEVHTLVIYDWKNKKETTNKFVLLHLLEQLDILDKEKTELYEASGKVRNAVLKEPKSGYPPLFRVKGAGLTWFVSEEAKEALESSDIKGVEFIPLIDNETRKTFRTSFIETTDMPKSSKTQTNQDDLSNFKPYVYPPKPDHIIPLGIEGLLTVYFAKDYDELVEQYGKIRLITNIVAQYKEDQEPEAVKHCMGEVSSLVAHEHNEKYLRDKIVNEYGVKITISKLGGSYQVFLERLHEELAGKRLYT